MRLLKTIGITLSLILSSLNGYSQNLIKVGDISNEIRLGPFAGERNLAVGVKNIVEEVLMDLDYDLSSSATSQINISLLFFDIRNTGRSIGVVHRNRSVTEIVAKGELIVDGDIKKTYTGKGHSTEIANSTLIVASDGSFNQQTASIALKKVLEEIVEGLL